MKLQLYILIAILSLSACTKNSSDVPEKPDTTPQTTLMYMTGTSLSYYFSKNITAAQSAITNNALGYGRFLVFKHSSATSASLTEYRYEKGACVSEVLKEYSYITSLSQEALEEVIADTKELAPADTYNLIVSGHSTGWVLKEYESSWDKVSPIDFTSVSAQEENINWEAMSSSPVVTRYMGSNEDSLFNIEEFKTSLETANTPFGYIIFDQCFMSSIEALYDLKDLCEYVIASPCEIMGPGFPYDTVLPKLYSNYGLEYDLQGVCEEYYNYYTTYSMPSGCVALTVTSELDALASITREINLNYSTQSVDTSTLQAYERLASHLFFDFEQYMLAVCTDDTISAEFTTQMEKAFPTQCRLHTERFFANIGESASSANNYDAYYTTLDYYSGVTTSAPSSRMRSAWEATIWAEVTEE